MKTIMQGMVIFMLCMTIKGYGQYVSIPDTVFGSWLSANGFSSCMMGNDTSGWFMDTTCAGIINDTTLYIPTQGTSLSDLNGIQYFDNLRHLRLGNGGLFTSIPALPPMLIDFDYRSGQLTTLPPLPGHLAKLYCMSNNLDSLPSFPNSLKVLNVSGNFLNRLPDLPLSLDTLICDFNLLDSVPRLPPTLVCFSCIACGLTFLPDLPDSLRYLDCTQNLGLYCLPRLGNIEGLFFTGTSISCLPNYPTGNVYCFPPYASLPLCTPGNSHGCEVFASDSSVWPGDADANGVADNNDLLPVGIAYGINGYARSVPSIVWQGQYCQDWSLQLVNGVNIKHADCNGDGAVNADDTLAIQTNFSLTHNKTNGTQPWRAGVPVLKAVLSADTLYSGDTLTITFTIGDSNQYISNIYGLAFTYNFDPTAVDSTFTSMRFGSSWLGSSDKISLTKTLNAPGQIKAAVTRIDHVTRSGYGPIATASFKITTDNISGKDYSYYANVGYISDITAIDNQGNPIQLNAGVDTSQIGYEPTRIKEAAVAKVSLYPNPAKTKLTIIADDPITTVSITDVAGQQVYEQTMARTKNLTMDVPAAMADGIYFVHVKTTRAAGIAKLSVIR